jgi:uncharacterized protein DUF1254
MAGRYYSVQFTDPSNNTNFAYVGKRTTGIQAGYYFAVAHVGLGEPQTAMGWFEKAFTDRSNGLVFLKVEPALDSLRQEPRFLALQHKLNFPNWSTFP